jgi:hypothetical protein
VTQRRREGFKGTKCIKGKETGRRTKFKKACSYNFTTFNIDKKYLRRDK